MMGKVVTGEHEPVTKTTSGIIVLPPEHNIIRDKQKDIERMRFIAKAACTQCSRCTDLCPRNLLGHSLEPHKIMRHLAYKPGMEGEILEDALICSECGVCEKFACPMMLSPREINSVLKQKCLAEGVKREPKRETYKVSPFFDNRKVPVRRLMERLEVVKYDTHPEFSKEKVQVRTATIHLKQHLGETSLPVVAVGDSVRRGDVIGDIPEGALGARVHASVDGTVSVVDDRQIIIQSS
jgi:Na+-translocating ferredoxin:NAD+ oxidoreductase RnfC subunit